MNDLAAQIRTELVMTISKRGGHLASNLGVVELTMAIHRVFNMPEDKIVFDVGHQSYVHKLLTGRYRTFCTLRSFGGMSGFPKRSESEYDVFETGHASTALSAALGLARARDLQGQHHHVLALVGDGAMTGGMCYEALNDAGDSHTSCDIFRMLDCKGVVRIDYMFDRASEQIYITEINTIPGSLAFYLWENKGVNCLLYTSDAADE